MCYQQQFSLPATTPQVIVYGPDPGFNGAQGEAESDIEALQAEARLDSSGFDSKRLISSLRLLTNSSSVSALNT